MIRVSILVLATALTCTIGCKKSGGSGDGGGNPPAKPGGPGNGGGGNGGGGNGGNGGSSSPFNHDVKQTDQTGTNQFPYVEAIDLADGRVELRFFTIPPVTMCSVDSFYNSSSFETKFKYFRVSVPKIAGQTTIRNGIDAEVGSRGEDFGGGSRTVTGTVNMLASVNNEYSGYVDAQYDRSKIQGNFKVRNCYSTKSLLNDLGILNLSERIEVSGNGRRYGVRIITTFQDASPRVYQEYISAASTFSLKIERSVDTPADIEDDFYGMVAGNYVGAGNTACSNASTGPAVARIDGNTMTFNQGFNNQPFFCKYESGRTNSGQLSVDPVTKKRKLTLNNRLGTFQAEF